MTDLLVFAIGSYGVWLAYVLSVTRGKHRAERGERAKHRGQWPGWKAMVTGWGADRDRFQLAGGEG